MRTNIWKAVPAAAVLCFGLAPMTASAQQPAKTPTPVQTALLEPPSSGTPASSAGASTSATSDPAAAAATNTTSTSTPTAVPTDHDAIIQQMAKEMADMKARMAVMETALKNATANDSSTAEHDANALRAAEGS